MGKERWGTGQTEDPDSKPSISSDSNDDPGKASWLFNPFSQFNTRHNQSSPLDENISTPTYINFLK